jgi:exodeoxyribonuclease-5
MTVSFEEIIVGAAGTGKTECIKTIQSTLQQTHQQFIVVTPTNRAAKVLRSRGIEATTIHRALYECYKTDQTKTVIKPVIDPITHMPRMENGVTVTYQVEEPVWEFGFKTDMPENLTVIIDEASMVQSRIWRDIIDFFPGKLIVVGDPNQLLPVETDDEIVDEYYRYFNQLALIPTKDLGNDDNNRRLDADTAGIFTAIKHINDPKNQLGDFPVLYGHNDQGYYYSDMRSNTDLTTSQRDILYEADVVICWTNAEREFINQLIRRQKSAQANRAYTGYPIVGDRIIADSAYDVDGAGGQPERIITRGDDLTIEQITDLDARNNIMWVKFADIDYIVPISVAHIAGGRVPRELKHLRWIYSYAITCHKAQGSGWDTVVVVDSYSRRDDGRRWRYTAATRARKTLAVLKSGCAFDKRRLT